MSKASENKKLIQCGFIDCRHWCSRDYSESPPDGTSLEKISIKIDDRRRSMYCSGCHKYTIYVCSQSEEDRVIEKYKLE